MCFSANADIAASVVVGAAGVDALRHVTRRSEVLLATLPLLFAVHSLVEAFVWWSLDGRVSDHVGDVAAWLYLLIAFGLVPVVVPVAVTMHEPRASRARMWPFAGLGAVVAVVLMAGVLRGPVTATVQGHHIVYGADLWHGGIVAAFYVVATCGPMLSSSFWYVRWFGLSNLVAVAILASLAANAFVSLWCIWAAVTSISIAVHLRLSQHPSTPRLSPVHAA